MLSFAYGVRELILKLLRKCQRSAKCTRQAEDGVAKSKSEEATDPLPAKLQQTVVSVQSTSALVMRIESQHVY